ERIELDYFLNKTILIHNWYDSARFQPPSIEERVQARNLFGINNEETFVIVMIGNCSSQKNHEFLFHELGRLNFRNKKDFLLLHVGQEEHGLPERELTEKLALEEKVKFLGFRDNILSVLHAGDVYVMPSTHEGFSIAVLEALATGLVVVLSD